MEHERPEADESGKPSAPAGIRAWLGTIWLATVAAMVVGMIVTITAGTCRFGSIAGLERMIGLELPADTILGESEYHCIFRPFGGAVLRMPVSSVWDFVSNGACWRRVDKDPDFGGPSAPMLRRGHSKPEDASLRWEGLSRGGSLDVFFTATRNADGTATVHLEWSAD